MSYRYLDDIATADIGFEARASTLEQLVVESGDALMNVMVDELTSITEKEDRRVVIEDEREDMLLFGALQEQIFLKDAYQLLFRLRNVHIIKTGNKLRLEAEAYGEEMDLDRHAMNVDVKAVTLHRFAVEHTDNAWTATVVLDV
ncbi:MAG: archease [Chitinivibrionales bacterium]|nr:archease [Chitinivibrionales bacterium]